MFDTIHSTVEQAGLDTTSLTIWLLDGVPIRLFWRGRRWRVVDTPTRIGSADAVWHPALTHPPAGWSGWRFAASDGATTQVLDVRAIGSGWQLLAAYD